MLGLGLYWLQLLWCRRRQILHRSFYQLPIWPLPHPYPQPRWPRGRLHLTFAKATLVAGKDLKKKMLRFIITFSILTLSMLMEYSGSVGSIPCLLMPWLLKWPEHQQARYWLCRTNKMYCCSRVNFIDLGQAKSKIRLKMWIWNF